MQAAADRAGQQTDDDHADRHCGQRLERCSHHERQRIEGPRQPDAKQGEHVGQRKQVPDARQETQDSRREVAAQSRRASGNGSPDAVAVLKDDGDGDEGRGEGDQHLEAAAHRPGQRRSDNGNDQQNAVSEQPDEPGKPEVPVVRRFVAHRREPQGTVARCQNQPQHHLDHLDQQKGVEEEALGDVHASGIAQRERERVAAAPGNQDHQGIHQAFADQEQQAAEPASLDRRTGHGGKQALSEPSDDPPGREGRAGDHPQ